MEGFCVASSCDGKACRKDKIRIAGPCVNQVRLVTGSDFI